MKQARRSRSGVGARGGPAINRTADTDSAQIGIPTTLAQRLSPRRETHLEDSKKNGAHSRGPDNRVECWSPMFG